MNTCKNCQNTFKGKYCNNCGEKVVNSSDFALKYIIAQAFDSITNFDSKVFQSLKLLFFNPGKLSLKFVEGIRVPYMKPFQLFVISNIVFFIFLSDIDLFRTPSKWFFNEYYDGINVMEKVRQISKIRGIKIQEIASLYDHKSSNLAKGFIILLIPFIALSGKLLHPNKKIEFGKHIIFATHYFTFVLLLFTIIIQTIKVIGIYVNRWFVIIPIVLIITLYYVISAKNFYKKSWAASTLKGIIAVVLIILVIQLYRAAINIVTLYSL